MIQKFGNFNECPANMAGQPVDDNEVDCEICYDTVKIWDAKCLKCNHYFCDSCFRDEIVANITQGKEWHEYTCLMGGCKCLIGMDFFRKLHIHEDKKLMFLYHKKIGQDIARRDQSVIICKVKDCDKYLKLPFDIMSKDVEKQKKAESRKSQLGYSCYLEKFPAEDHFCHCYNPICTGCEDLGHEPARCEDANKWRANLEKKKDQLSDLWIMKNSKKCPHCGIPTEKNAGCDHMTCKSCKGHWCWICGSGDWKDYGHKCNPGDLNRKAISKEAIKRKTRTF